MADPENVPPAAPSKAPISFSFTRTSARRRLADPTDSEGRTSEEKDFLTTVEGRELQSVNPPEAPKELVIPLIQNGSRRQPLAKNPKPSSESRTALMSDGVLSLAVKELIEESKKSMEERENAGVDPTLTIPMVQKGCNPSEEGTDSEPQAETVPEEADYEAVPVEAYGLAMLRGMGWKPGKGIGNTFSQVVKPRVNTLRPKGLGLGANLMEAKALASAGSHHPPRPDGDREKHKEGLMPGGAVVVLSGPFKGLYGKVEGLDPDNVRAMVRLAVGNRIVTVSEYCLQPVTQQEFDSHASQPGHMSKTSTEHHNRTTGTGVSLKALQNQEDSKRRQKDSERKRKHSTDRQDRPVAKSEKATSKNKHWLHRDLRVRFIDKQHKGGRYYNTKMTIEDVLSPGTCVCRTDEGRVLEGVREDMLETLIPKGEGHRVMVVLGTHAGKVGLLLSRDSVKSQALVQLKRENQVVELHYDAICQYVGPSDSDED
ncbi:G-patch domain and KOW motifs-containing protein [Phodopus roborovskii]|uniref:G-patch domain and KOW motifs-containing protein n=1 Tax=Phodopus roborovskii TaxID=109678 RepID=A0AAU9Z1E2_PHORO|nr:G-patch domain and KOW motifs-containing protein [Phodopus roborovskii]CAH6780430.1 Gpkow [Phodopus roborovskii]